MGRIAAGVPIEAIQSQSHSIPVPVEMLPPGDHFALEVRGDSMIEAGILDGDTVVIRRGDTADTGDIVVALVVDAEATLKAAAQEGGHPSPEAANPAYETRIFGPDGSASRASWSLCCGGTEVPSGGGRSEPFAQRLTNRRDRKGLVSTGVHPRRPGARPLISMTRAAPHAAATVRGHA